MYIYMYNMCLSKGSFRMFCQGKNRSCESHSFVHLKLERDIPPLYKSPGDSGTGHKYVHMKLIMYMCMSYFCTVLSTCTYRFFRVLECTLYYGKLSFHQKHNYSNNNLVFTCIIIFNITLTHFRMYKQYNY